MSENECISDVCLSHRFAPTLHLHNITDTEACCKKTVFAQVWRLTGEVSGGVKRSMKKTRPSRGELAHQRQLVVRPKFPAEWNVAWRKQGGKMMSLLNHFSLSSHRSFNSNEVQSKTRWGTCKLACNGSLRPTAVSGGVKRSMKKTRIRYWRTKISKFTCLF